ncbi:MAG TPA: polysaccharide biosynthesis tyrosine autokinase [Verrucomicrobiota bacterium]|nr:polysaccharide biosynthesis tyrosine autokinase [Verrucomicrobiota bacterium]HNU49592.1 polysaccharide biosynthesis tyrosine autokinase [Verrucomicrobiota bacterium]
MAYYPQTATNETFEAAAPAANLNLRHYWHVVLERRWLVIAAFVSVFVLCLVYLYKAPRVYEASTRVQIDRETDSSLNLGQAIMSLGAMDQDYLQTQYKNLLSRSLIETVIKKEKLAEDPRYAKELDIAKEVTDDITVAPIRMTRLVEVSVQHTSPQKAANIANTLVNDFIEQNTVLRQKRTLDMLFFLKSQANGLERDVAKAEEEIQNYRMTAKFVSLDANFNLIADSLSTAQAKYAEMKARAQTAQTSFDELDRHIKAGKPLHTFPTIAADAKVSSLQMTIISTERDLAVLLERYKDKHPSVIEARTRLEETQRALDHATQQVVDTLRAEVALAKAAEENLNANVKEWEQRQMDWNAAKTQYDVLMRKAETSKALFNTVLTKMKEIELVQKDKPNNIRVIDPAAPPTIPVKPRIALTLILGAVGGLAIAIGLAFFVNYLDDSIKSQDDVETYLHLPFLGYVPNIKSNSVVERDLQAHLHPQSNAAESFRTVRAAIALGSKADKLRVLTVTSTIPSEGKSLVASNVAIVMAQTGLKTLLLDSDMRRPSVHKAFQLHSPVGLSAYLTEKTNSIDELIHTTEVPNLDVICCGPSPSQPSELLGSRRMMQFMQEISRRYDRVIMDCPPISAVSDPLVLSAMADGVVFVTKFNKIRREHARRTVQRLQDAGIHICGVVLNDIDFEGRDSYYYSYYYYQNRYYSSYYRARGESKTTAAPASAAATADKTPAKKA